MQVGILWVACTHFGISFAVGLASMVQSHGCFLQAQLFLQLSLDRGSVGLRIALLLLSKVRGLVEPLTTGGLVTGNNN